MQETFFLFIFSVLIIFVVKDYKKSLISLFFIFLLYLHLKTWNYNLWDSGFLIINYWRLVLISLVSFSFLVIINIIKDHTFEIIFLFLMVLLGSVIIILSDNLIIIYLGLELQTFSVFILIVKNRKSFKSSEGGLKYFIFGALSSGLFLMGLSILFSAQVNMNLTFINQLLILNNYELFGLNLILFSLIFKFAIFPLHFWIPDVFEGSDWDVISFLSTITKISYLVVLVQTFYFSTFLLFLSLMSIVVGSIGGFNQTKIKRLMGYSSISHIGFILLGLSVLYYNKPEISFLYLTIYVLTLLGFFLLVNKNYFSNSWLIIEMGNNITSSKIMVLSWLVIVLSIAGIPPLAGFIGKWWLFFGLLDFDSLLPLIVSIIFSIISIGFYLRLVKINYFQPKSNYLVWKNILLLESNKISLSNYLLGIIIYFSISLIFFPSIIYKPFFLLFNYIY